MTKILYILLILLAIPIIHAACDYADQEIYVEEGKGLCLPGTQSSQGKGLVISDITEGERPSFTAYNPNSFPVKAYFNYTISGFLNEEKFSSKPIGSKDTEKIDRVCFKQDTYGNCSITRIDYFLTEPRKLEPCVVNFTKTRDICNKPCRKDIDCTSTVCNIAGFCGKEKIVPCQDGTINCNDQLCLKPGTKKGGEAFSCEWECSSGIGVENTCKEKDGIHCEENIDCVSGICNVLKQCGEKLLCPTNTLSCNNIACVVPTNTSIGKSYLCDWECKTGYGKDGVCKLTPAWTRIIYIGSAGIIFILLLLGYFFIVHRKVKKEYKKAKEDYDKVNKDKKELVAEKEKAEQELESTQTEKDKISRRLSSVENKLENIEDEYEKKEETVKKEYAENIKDAKEAKISAEKEAKEAKNKKKTVEIQYRNAENKLKRAVENLTNSKEELEIKQRKLEKISIEFKDITKKFNTIANEADEKQKILDEIRKNWDKIEKPFPDPQVNNRLVIINPFLGGYRCFYQENITLPNYPFSSLVHRWVWKHNTGKNPRYGYHIHHKDGNKYNNDFSNLDEIPGKEHYMLHSQFLTNKSEENQVNENKKEEGGK